MKPAWIKADWEAPPLVHALCTTRAGGVSTRAFASFNLATHVGDAPAAVTENRALLREALGLPSGPRWLNQVHGRTVAHFGIESPDAIPMADAAVTSTPGVVLAIMTADCLPVLLTAWDGSEVAVAHAGWRGLAAGVIEATVAEMSHAPRDLVAWLGPAIGAAHYEVDATVRAAFADSPGVNEAFTPGGRPDHWQCSLVALARARLATLGVPKVTGGAWDTFADPERFYSYRRGGNTGRMATLIWCLDRYCFSP